jgi:hypothetical protein
MENLTPECYLLLMPHEVVAYTRLRKPTNPEATWRLLNSIF